MNKPFKFSSLPFILRAITVMLFFIIIAFVLWIWQGFLIPFALSVLLSILLYPISRKFEIWFKMSRDLANLTVILCLFAIIGGVICMCYNQITSFIGEIDSLKEQINQKLFNIQRFVNETTGIKPKAQIKWLNEQLDSLISNSGNYVSMTLSTFGNTLATVGIMVVYVFFMMFYREKFFLFFKRMIPSSNHEKMFNILVNTKNIIQSYISGVFLVMVIIFTVLGTGLFAMGIPFALFLALLTAILNVVPYIGILISAALAVIITFVTKENTWYVTGTLSLYFVTHWIEANILTPKVVGKKVAVNPMITFIMLIIGAEVWGVVGMILFVPFIGIIKVVCDNIPSLEPYSILLDTKNYIPKDKYKKTIIVDVEVEKDLL